MGYQQQRDEFMCIMAIEVRMYNMNLERTADIAKWCRDIMFQANKIARWALKLSNVGLEQEEYEQLYKDEAKAALLCEKLGIRGVYSLDPRGAALKLILPSGTTTDFANIGVVVPQRIERVYIRWIEMLMKQRDKATT